MTGWTVQAGTYEDKPRVDDTDSLQAMDRAAKTTRGASATVEPVLPCQQGQVWLEFTVLDSNGVPVADTDCTLKIPEGNGMTQKTDATGYVKFEGVSADPQSFTLRVNSVAGDGGDSRLAIDVVPRQQPAEAPAQSEAPRQEHNYVDLPWERDSLIWSAGT